MIKRNTKPKQLVLASLKEAGAALSQDLIQAALDGAADRATIYRVLNGLCAEGTVHRIVGDDGKQYFAYCINCSEQAHRHNHFHFRCVDCGKVECLKQEVELKVPKGYKAHHFNGFISGQCAACAAQTK